MTTSTSPRSIVVGVHDTPDSIAAMRRAVSEARDREVAVDIVHIIPANSDARVAEAADRMLTALIRRAFPAGLLDLAEPARLRIECGDPGEVLVLLCASAELLVIGACANSDRRGIYASNLVRFCLTRAPCPVVICADHGATSRSETIWTATSPLRPRLPGEIAPDNASAGESSLAAMG